MDRLCGKKWEKKNLNKMPFNHFEEFDTLSEQYQITNDTMRSITHHFFSISASQIIWNLDLWLLRSSSIIENKILSRFYCFVLFSGVCMTSNVFVSVSLSTSRLTWNEMPVVGDVGVSRLMNRAKLTSELCFYLFFVKYDTFNMTHSEYKQRPIEIICAREMSSSGQSDPMNWQ